MSSGQGGPSRSWAGTPGESWSPQPASTPCCYPPICGRCSGRYRVSAGCAAWRRWSSIPSSAPAATGGAAIHPGWRTSVRRPRARVGHPAGGEPVEPAGAVVHRHTPAPPGQHPQLILQPPDRLRGDPDPDLRAGEKEPEAQQPRLRGVPDRGLLPVHRQLQPPPDHAADALEHPPGSPFATHENPEVIGLCLTNL